ncbi:MAG: HEPN domain-containing protein [Candidatus Bipolaricaulia bacterium]
MNKKYQEYDDPGIWLERARSNLSLAKTNPENVFLEDLCFEAQQAAEKATKALLIYSNCDYPYTHDMAELLTLLQEETDLKIPESVKQMPRLTRFAVASRYPGPIEPISDEEYQKALEIAEHVVKWARDTIE